MTADQPPGGLAFPWAAAQQVDVVAEDFGLLAVARRRRETVRWWWGQRIVDGTNGALCYLCGYLIVSWSRRYPITEQARRAVLVHRDDHIRQIRSS